ncbi:MAG TPA: T9SS type A sorting domain-containing protein, partial [Bacteroidia bacterium]
IDSLYVTAINGDTINFEIKNDVTGNTRTSQFLKIGNKISLTGMSDTTLLYDFDLNINDTFFLTNKSSNEKLILDSIVSIKLENGIDYRHFYLHSLNSDLIVWVENIGEKHHGWDYRGYNIMDKPGLCAVCSSDSLVWSDSIYYWDYYVSGIKLKYVKPDCSFYELKRKVGMDELAVGMNIYPNPANDYLYINVQYNFTPQIEIYTMEGKLIYAYSNDDTNSNKNCINISGFESGVYQLVYKIDAKERRIRFVKVD